MNRTLEIPPIEEVGKLPKGGRAWMFASIRDHDAALELRCENVDSERPIDGASIELRTLTGQEGFSLNTGKAIADIVCASRSDFSELEVGETVWRPAERRNGIILLSRQTHNHVNLILINMREACSVILSTEGRVEGRHSIHLEDILFRRFLALGGAMQRDWENADDRAQQFRGMVLHEAMRKNPGFFFGPENAQLALQQAQIAESMISKIC